MAVSLLAEVAPTHLAWASRSGQARPASRFGGNLGAQRASDGVTGNALDDMDARRGLGAPKRVQFAWLPPCALEAVPMLALGARPPTAGCTRGRT